MAGGFECSMVELDIVGAALGVDVRPFPFQFPVFGDLLSERRRFVELVHRSLTAKGLIDGPSFAPVLAESVSLFGRGRLSIAMLGTAGEHTYCARATSDGRSGVLAVRSGELVRFDPITQDSLVHAVVELLPPLRPGPGGSVTITGPDGTAPRDRRDNEDFSERSYLRIDHTRTKAGGGQWAAAERIMALPRLGSGYFVVTVRGRNGRESEPLTMNWLDTEAGRFAVLPSVGPDGRTHVTYTPADLARLDQHLSRLVATLD